MDYENNSSTDKVDWNDYSYRLGEMGLPDNWVHVVSLVGGSGYDWADLHAFYSPKERLYFWHGDSGCSCWGWGYDINSVADFNNGDRAALRAALKGFAEDYPSAFTPSDAISKIDALARFNPPEVTA